MFDAEPDTNLEAGTWNRWQTGKDKILFSCPKCSMVVIIDQDVLPDGRVVGKVSCANSKCGFKDYIRLNGWKPAEEEQEEK